MLYCKQKQNTENNEQKFQHIILEKCHLLAEYC